MWKHQAAPEEHPPVQQDSPSREPRRHTVRRGAADATLLFSAASGLLLFGALLAPGCSSPPDDPSPTPSSSPTPLVAHLEVSPSSLEFGSVMVAKEKTAELELHNSGEDALLLTVTLPDNPSNQYQVSYAGGAVPDQIEAGQTLLLSVRFAPVKVGDAPGILRVDSSDLVTPRTDVVLAGEAISNPDLVDNDGDGYSTETGDCDDDDDTVYPEAAELCDGKDNDCDKQIDEEPPFTFYRDRDDDGFGDDTSTATGCEAPKGFVEQGGDCNDGDAAVNPDADEVCDAVDNDCDGELDEDLLVTWYTDSDQDGYGDPDNFTDSCLQPPSTSANSEDCDDTNAGNYPGADELCDRADNDCDGEMDEGLTSEFYPDGDGDGHGTEAGALSTCTPPEGFSSLSDDCNDADGTIYPGAAESCDGKDNDCDGQVDEEGQSTFYRDQDGDGHGDATVSKVGCLNPSGYVSSDDDCNDRDASVYPGATEVCNGKDENCDGQADEGVKTTYYLDADRDTYGNPNESVEACSKPSSSYSTEAGDCDDLDAKTNPAGTETCDLKDNDCDSEIDEGVLLTYYADLDDDGFGNPAATTEACSAPAGYVAINTDCNDAREDVHPGAPELCDEADNDCDIQIDEGVQTTYYADADLDGYGNSASSLQACSAPEGYVSNQDDCNDSDSSIHPGGTELCDSLDNDCDESVDEPGDPSQNTYFLDSDEDGYGDSGSTVSACSTPEGYSDASDDCDDDDSDTYPGAIELCAGEDNNCDGVAHPVAPPTPSSNSPVCSGDSLSLQASTIAGASYRWTGPNGFTSTEQNPSLTSVSSASAGEYEVFATVDGCETDGALHPVSVTSVSAAFEANPSSARISETVQFVATETGITGYNWTFEGGTPSTSTSASPTVTWSATGTYSVSLTASKSGCTSSSTSTVTIIDTQPSCKTYKTVNPSAASGVYTLDPDGSGSAAPYQVYCDMSQDGGGWTLVMNLNTANGDISTFNMPIWTTSSEKGTFANRWAEDYKSKAAQDVSATQLLLVIRTNTASETATPIGWRSWNLASARTFNSFFSGTPGDGYANATGGCNAGYSGAGVKQTNGIKSTGVVATYDPFTNTTTDVYTNSYYGSCGSTQDGFRMSNWYRWANNSNVGLGLQMDNSSQGQYSLEVGAHLKIETYTNPQRFCSPGNTCVAYPDGSYGYTSTKVAIGTDHYSYHSTVGVNYRYEWYVQ